MIISFHTFDACVAHGPVNPTSSCIVANSLVLIKYVQKFICGGIQIDPTDVFANNLGHWIRRIYHEITISINDILRPYGLARSQWEVLYRIASSNGVTQKDLQTAMKVESGTLTGIMDSLVKKGWIIREEHPRDRRIKLLRMTEQGNRKWMDIPNPIDVLRPHMMNGITPEDEAFVVKLLQKAVLNLESLDHEEVDQ